jgi:hypothetical protein
MTRTVRGMAVAEIVGMEPVRVDGIQSRETFIMIRVVVIIFKGLLSRVNFSLT